MNALIEFCNTWGDRLITLAVPMLWQSSLLIAAVFGLDFALRRRIRGAIRYALWMVVLVKLVLPPTLASPSALSWWVRPSHNAAPQIPSRTLVVTYNDAASPAPVLVPATPVTPPPPQFSAAGKMLLGGTCMAVFILGWAILRWVHISRMIRATSLPPDDVAQLLADAQSRIGLHRRVAVRVTLQSISPAVCGLFRPVILLPQSLIEKLSGEQLRAVLLHELVHLKRADVWVNCAQTLLQIIYWWHPLLWLANARIRRVREEAVDDAVMFALKDDAELYAPTLLEVAKLAFRRPLASLGLVGILESKNALRQRIERLVNLPTPRQAGLSIASALAIVAFSAMAVPMGEAPRAHGSLEPESESTHLVTLRMKVDPTVFIRNIRSRAPETLHAPDDSWGEILLTILETYGVDTTPPRAFALNSQTGDITTQNTPEAVDIIQKLCEELNRADGKRTFLPPQQQQVLLVAEFYQMRSADFDRLQLKPHHDADSKNTSWQSLSPEELPRLQQQLKTSGLEPFSKPRIQTGPGIEAKLFTGTPTNNIELDCMPVPQSTPILDNGRKIGSVPTIALRLVARTTGKFRFALPDWPDFDGITNCAIFGRVQIEENGGAIFRAENPFRKETNNLVLVLKPTLVSNSLPVSVAPSAVRPAVPTDSQENQAVGPRTTTKTNVTGNPTNRLEPNIQNARGITSKISHIHLDTVQFDNLALPDVLNLLSKEVKAADPDGTGINFLLRPKDIDSAVIHIKSPLTNAPLLDVLDAIVAGADKPMKYSLRPEMIEFSAKGSDADSLHTRTFKVETDQFLKELARSVSDPMVASGSPRVVQAALVKFLSDRGVDIQPPKSIFFNEKREMLYIRATTQDLDRVEQILTVMAGPQNTANTTAPANGNDQLESHIQNELGITSKFSHIHLDTVQFDHMSLPDVLAALAQQTRTADPEHKGINFMFANTTNMASVVIHMNSPLTNAPVRAVVDAIVAGANKPIQYSILPYAIEFSPKPDSAMLPAVPQLHLQAKFIEVDPNDWPAIWMQVSNNSSPANTKTFVGILTESQERQIQKELGKRKNTDLLSRGEITMLSGRHAEFQTGETRTVVTGLAVDHGTNKLETTNMFLGPKLDVFPAVLADGLSISMTVNPRVTEFLGYDKPTELVKGTAVPLPRFRVWETTSSATVLDGQTLVLGVSDEKESVGEAAPQTNADEMRSTQSKPKKRLLVFITANVVDAAGNRLHGLRKTP